jgi:hypothetical protein
MSQHLTTRPTRIVIYTETPDEDSDDDDNDDDDDGNDNIAQQISDTRCLSICF